MKMIRCALGVASTLLVTAPSLAHAVDARMARVLMRIDPDTRLEQVCDIEAMRRIEHHGRYAPDRAKSDVVEHPIHAGDRMSAHGAAFRSRGKWYGLSFECTATPDHLKVVSFAFQIGGPIPTSRWPELGLWR